jgi:peroxiredoxin
MKPFNQILLRTVLAASLFFATSHLAQALEVGDKAPEFELDSTAGGKLKLSSLKGKNVLINVYVLDYSPT